MNGYRESDSFIVSKKSLNKMRDNKRMAEGMEKRRLVKGNLSRQNRGRALNRVTLQSESDQIRQETARKYPRQEPIAVVPLAGSVRGVPGNRHSYRELPASSFMARAA